MQENILNVNYEKIRLIWLNILFWLEYKVGFLRFIIE